MINDDVILIVGGRKYGGWKEIEVVRSIETLANGFSLTAAAKEDGSGADFQFRAGAACSIAIGTEKLFDGWVEQVKPEYSDTGHSITVSGRDRTGDLVDCSAVHKTGSWRNARIEAIAAELAQPFGINVSATADTGAPLAKFALQQGETVFAAIERMLRYRGLLAVSTVEGNVEIISPKKDGVDFAIDPAWLKEAQATHDTSERFSQYIVKGQASGSDNNHGAAVSKVRAEATDPAVSRYRPMLVIGEEQSSIDALGKRANWEAVTRSAKAQGATLTMAGWRTGKQLYAPNRIALLRDARLFIDSPMLLSSVTFLKGQVGTVSKIELAPPEAFGQLPVPEERIASRVKAKAKAKGQKR